MEVSDAATKKVRANFKPYPEYTPDQKDYQIPITMPDYFPMVHPECTDVAIPYFSCLTKMSDMINDSDLNAGVRGVNSCLPLKSAYERCMEDSILSRTNKVTCQDQAETAASEAISSTSE